MVTMDDGLRVEAVSVMEGLHTMDQWAVYFGDARIGYIRVNASDKWSYRVENSERWRYTGRLTEKANARLLLRAHQAREAQKRGG